MALKNNTWKLNQWYDQDVAGNVSYSGATQLFSWGRNEKGQLALNTGPGDQGNRSSPVQVGSLETWKSITYGMATRSDGTLWVWGNNGNGNLGQNNTTQRSSPVQIPGTTWGTGEGSVFRGQPGAAQGAIKSDGTIWMWGGNGNGQLGLNNATGYSSPIQIGSDTTWSSDYMKACTNGTNSFAIKTDGTLWSWGGNGYGQLGQANNTQYSSPKQVGSDTTWKTVSTNKDAVLATKTDGTLWGWGLNEYGALGLNNETNYDTPQQIPGTTWKHATQGYQFGFATKTDGTLWTWGYQGVRGRLGHNNNTNRSSPVQVPGTTWDKPLQQYKDTTTGALKTDGTLWMWGQNEYGTMGNNEGPGSSGTGAYSSPVQVPGNWSRALVDYQACIAVKEL